METLQSLIRQFARVAVAVSGGTDSAIILREAAAAIGMGYVLAITVQTGCMPRRRLFVAKRASELSGVEQRILQMETLSESELYENSDERCTQCRFRMLQSILDEAWLHGCDAVLDGRHLGDQGCPAYSIAADLGLYSPYCVSELGEAQLVMLRGDIQKHLPDDSCLYSRFQKGQPISEELAHCIDCAEEKLRTAGYSGVQLHIREEGAILVAPQTMLPRLQTQWGAVMPIVQNAGIHKPVLLMEAEAMFADMSPLAFT